MSATKQYELVYIAAPEATEQQLAELHELVVGITAKFNGTIDRTEAWGRRRLAYTIGRHKEGIYVLEVITAGGDLVKELDRRLKVSDLVIRHLVVRVDEDLAVAARAKAERQATSAIVVRGRDQGWTESVSTNSRVAWRPRRPDAR